MLGLKNRLRVLGRAAYKILLPFGTAISFIAACALAILVVLVAIATAILPFVLIVFIVWVMFGGLS